MPINPLLTSSFSQFKPHMGVPINTAVKPARWMAGIDSVDGLKPSGIFGKPQFATEFPYRVAYRERLDSLEDQIQSRLQDLSAQYPATAEHPNGQPLVLLCWCNVHKGDWCHRRMFAEWLAERDVDVPEAPVIAAGSTGQRQRAPRVTVPKFEPLF